MFALIKQTRLLVLLLSISIIASCSSGFIGGNYQENLKKLDKTYGYCDNPQRNLKSDPIAYKVCKDKESAAGADGITDDDFKLPLLDDVLNNRSGNQQIVYNNSVNKYLWNGSLSVLSKYPLKTVDSNGGYLETEWIYEQNIDDQRCTIKIQINSVELVSTGVSTSMICQRNYNDKWVIDDEEYIDEENRITLAILAAARQFSTDDTVK